MPSCSDHLCCLAVTAMVQEWSQRGVVGLSLNRKRLVVYNWRETAAVVKLCAVAAVVNARPLAARVRFKQCKHGKEVRSTKKCLY